jgi:hypothetical protein
MMHGREKSDPAIVAVKPTNKAVPTAAEPVEQRAGAKGNANQQSTHRTQPRRLPAYGPARSAGIRLITRRGNDWTTRFPLGLEAVNHLKVRSCLIDGEVERCDERGLARFDVRRQRKPRRAAGA